jgi:hypothetical protein
VTYANATQAARAAKAEHCLGLSRDCLAAFIELIDAPPSTRFESWQAAEHRCLVAGALWAEAIVAPLVVGSTVLRG